MPGSFRVARILGIDIRIHISWLLIFFLITISLAQQQFARIFPTSELKALATGAIAAVLFFTSVVAHELAHALVARRFHLPVSSITLFILGGVASLTKEPATAKSEFFMAAAGPSTSLVIAGGAWGVSKVLAGSIGAAPTLVIPVMAITDYLAQINFAVALFNLVPGFPLDGGRVLRSAIWAVGGDRSFATRVAARGGQIVAVVLFLIGANATFLEGEPTGLWFWIIAFFLFNLASASLQQERVTSAVGSVRVRQLMTTDFRSVPPAISIGQLIRDVVLPNNLQAIPVVAQDRLVGLVTIADLRKVEQDQWPTTPVEAVMRPASELATVSPDDELVAAIDRFTGAEVPVLPVVDHGSLVGVLFRDAVVGYVRMQETLGVGARR